MKYRWTYYINQETNPFTYVLEFAFYIHPGSWFFYLLVLVAIGTGTIVGFIIPITYWVLLYSYLVIKISRLKMEFIDTYRDRFYRNTYHTEMFELIRQQAGLLLVIISIIFLILLVGFVLTPNQDLTEIEMVYLLIINGILFGILSFGIASNYFHYRKKHLRIDFSRKIYFLTIFAGLSALLLCVFIIVSLPSKFLSYAILFSLSGLLVLLASVQLNYDPHKRASSFKQKLTRINITLFTADIIILPISLLGAVIVAYTDLPDEIGFLFLGILMITSVGFFIFAILGRLIDRDAIKLYQQNPVLKYIFGSGSNWKEDLDRKKWNTDQKIVFKKSPEEKKVKYCPNCEKSIANSGSLVYNFCPDCKTKLIVKMIS